MIRRRNYARSKNGCVTCKVRHVRCDERRPFCRNCLRLGRLCIFSPTAPEKSSNTTAVQGEGESIRALPAPQATQQTWVAANKPQQHAIEFAPGHQRGLSTAVVDVTIQTYKIFSSKPWPQTCLSTILYEYLPRFNYFGSQFKSVKYAHASFGALIHHQETKSVSSKEIALTHTCAAFKLIKEEIERLSPSSVDALVTASIWLASSAENWEQLEVFVNGYSKALAYIRKENLKTVYPNLLTERFNFRDFVIRPVSRENTAQDRLRVHKRVVAILDAICKTKETVGYDTFYSVGLAELEKVAHSVEEACFCNTEEEVFENLMMIRKWLFWIELGPGGTDEQFLLNCQFFALALAAMPLFPAKFSGSIADACLRRMRASMKSMSEEAVEKFAMLDFCEQAQNAYWQNKFETDLDSAIV